MAIAGDNVFFASAAELNAGWRKGDYSCEELTKAFVDRLERLGASHNALALSLRGEALKKAKDVDGERKRDPGEALERGRVHQGHLVRTQVR